MISDILRNIGRVFTWFIVVAPWEQAIRVRAGRHVRLLQAGFYIRIPFIDRVYRQSVRRRLSIIRPQTLTTRDGKAVTVSGALGYQIEDLQTLYNSIHDAADTIEAEVTGIVAAFIAKTNLADCGMDAVSEHVRGRLELGKYGLGHATFFLTNFAAVRTLRIITGDFPSWQQAPVMDTTAHDTENKL